MKDKNKKEGGYGNRLRNYKTGVLHLKTTEI
jgi:hypothetical protein